MENKGLNENSRFFISYASEDRSKVKEYEEALRQNGFKIWLDQQDIHLSDSIVAKINLGIEGSKYALVFYSKYYKNKIWTQEEMAALIFAAISSEETRKIFVIKLDDTELPPLLSHRLWNGDTAPKKFAQSISLMIQGQTEELSVHLENTTPNMSTEETISLSELDSSICIVLAKAILDNSSKFVSSKVSVVRVPKGKSKLYVEIWTEALNYDLIADLKHWLNMIHIHSEYINDYRTDLAEGALGKFKAGFRLAMEQKITDRDTAQNELKNYLEVVCKKITLINYSP